MKNLTKMYCIRASLLAISLSFSMSPAMSAPSQAIPPVLKQLEKKGVHFVDGQIPAPAGMTGWAGYHGDQPLAFYVAADGKVIVGSLLDGNGKDLTRDPLLAAVKGSMTDNLWTSVTHTNWIADGKATAPRVIYVFTDPNCPYCNKFWSDARPWVKAGKVQLRHIMIGIITKTSSAKAAAIMASKDPVAALEKHEADRAEAGRRSPGSAMGHELDSTGIPALAKIPVEIQDKLDSNMQTMFGAGLQATPSLVWRDNKGEVQTRQGVPPSSLSEILGPL